MIRALSVFAVLLASLLAGPAASAHEVTVAFAAVYGTATATTGFPASACTLSVEEGANGIAVLDAAVATGCIDSYATTSFPGLGSFVNCIDGICGGADAFGLCQFWAFHDNGLPALDHGVDGFRATNGGSIEFVLEPYGAAALGC